MVMDKGIISYTDNLIGEPILSTVQNFILQSGLPIVSCSLKPIDFGVNVVLNEERSYPTMVKQIITALEKLEAENVFFCEHDVLHHRSHFDFEPEKNDLFYYNSNVWRWKFGGDKAICYDKMLPLSCLCCNRELALDHYRLRLKKINERPEEFQTREPKRVRIWGYEPGSKSKRNGGLTSHGYDTWHSDFPNIDIRHNKTFSPSKCDLADFKHPPTNWQEISVDEIPGWSLRDLWI